MILNNQIKSLTILKWAHVTALTFIGGLLVILPMATSDKVSFQNLQNVLMITFGIVLLLAAATSFFQLGNKIRRLNVLYIVLLVSSIGILLYCAYYVYRFNRSQGHIPLFISAFIWGGIALSAIIIFREMLGKSKPLLE